MNIANIHFIKLALLFTFSFVLFDGTMARQASVNIVMPVTENVMDDPYRSEFFPVESAPKISVKTINGNVDVYRNSAINGVQVDLYVERSFSLWSGTRNLDNYRIIIQKRGNHIIASVEDRSRGGSARRSGDIQFHFVVQVPADASTDLRTINGNIELDGVKGTHFLQNQNGEIFVNNSGGEIRVLSATGSLKLNSLQGSIFAKTVTGEINIADNEGEVRVRSTSGSISVERMNGNLAAATTSGNIVSDFTDVTTGIYLETVSGNVNLTIPADNGYDIKGKALQFDISGIQQASITRQSRGMNERNIVLRDGDIPVQMSTVSGTIRVLEKH